MSIMTEDQIRVTLSKAKYWNEVIKRENTDILQEELLDEVRRLGVSILFILEDYAEKNKGEAI
jgi:hypothetical protein